MMAEPSVDFAQRQRKRAAAAVAVLAAVACAFMLLVAGLAQLGATDDAGMRAGTSSQESPFYVLLIGSDSRKGTALYTGKAQEHAQVDQHADIITLMRVDPQTYTITLLTIPRDTQLEGEDAKINDRLAADNNPAAVVEACELLTGVEIDYYMMIGFTAFETLVDDLGGVDANVPCSMELVDAASGRNVALDAGTNQHLDGAEALVLARTRKTFETDQDALRQVSVRALEAAMLGIGLDEQDSAALETYFASLAQNTETDMDLTAMLALATDFAAHREQVVIYTGTGTYAGGENEAGLWVVPQDAQTWELLMAVVDAGGDPAGIVEEPRF